MAHAGHEIALGPAQDLQLRVALLELARTGAHGVLELAAVAQLALAANSQPRSLSSYASGGARFGPGMSFGGSEWLSFAAAVNTTRGGGVVAVTASGRKALKPLLPPKNSVPSRA